jgi:tetratricopeptide (TPR) repeat protein
MAMTLRLEGRLAASIAAMRKATFLRPEDPAVLRALSETLLAARRPEEAEIVARRAIDAEPNDQALETLLARCVKARGRFSEAERRLIDLVEENENDEAKIELGTLRLGLGKAIGSAFSDIAGNGVGDAEWDGLRPVAGLPILVDCGNDPIEALFSLRFVEELVRRGALPTMRVNPGLASLISAKKGIVAVGTNVEIPPFPAFIPSKRLPVSLGVDAPIVSETLPNARPLARPLPLPPSMTSGRILKVGLAWSEGKADDAAAEAIAAMIPMLSDPRIAFVSLQTGEAAREIERTGIGGFLIDAGRGARDAADLAAAIDAVDVVVCVESSVAHIGAEMRKTTIVALPSTASWRFGLVGRDSPWHSTVIACRAVALGEAISIARGELTRIADSAAEVDSHS